MSESGRGSDFLTQSDISLSGKVTDRRDWCSDEGFCRVSSASGLLLLLDPDLPGVAAH